MLFILVSCSQDNKSVKPEKFIEKEKMISLIVEMKIAQKAKTVLNKEKKKNQNYMSTVYEKFQIDSAQFKKNSDYYTERLEVYSEIYTEVYKRLNDSLNKYNTLKKKKDSITRIKKDSLKLNIDKRKKKFLKKSLNLVKPEK